MALRANVRKTENCRWRQFALDREIVVFSVGLPVVDVIAGRVGNGQVAGIIQGFVGRIARDRELEREALPLRSSIESRPVRLFESYRKRGGPVAAKWSITHFVKEIEIFNGCVVDPERSSNTGFARAAK